MNFDFSAIEYGIWILVGCLTLVQVLYFTILYNAIHRRHTALRKGKQSTASEQPGISVVIVAADQGHWLEKNLPSVLAQDYPNFEVIVVNDNSTDDTETILQGLQQQYPQLYTTFTSSCMHNISRKKLAMMLGIKACKNEWVVFTEPYCHPTSRQWLAQLALHFTPDTDVVAGYTNYAKGKGFVNRCMQFDTLHRQVRMLGHILCGHGYMATGTNMAYRRQLFFDHKGYSRHLRLERGEDDLFVHENAKSKRMQAEVQAAATVCCDATSYTHWQNERLNRMFIQHMFRGSMPYVNAGESWSNLLFYLTFIGSAVLCLLHQWWITTGILCIFLILHTTVQEVVFYHLSKDLHERRFNGLLILWNLLRPWWQLWFLLKSAFTPKRNFYAKING